MSDFVNINIHISGTEYPLKVNQKDESVIKEAEKIINTNLSELQKNFGGIDKKDLLAMGLIQIVSKLLKNHSESDTELIHAKAQLKQFEALITEFETKLV
jgi:cell division protein ZapA (FtsZ GTPase activity inhibitor)